MTDIDRRVLMRALIEDPEFHHEKDIGLPVYTDTAFDDLEPHVVAHVAVFEAQHPANLLAQTAVVPRPMGDIELDVAAVVAKFEQAKGDE